MASNFPSALDTTTDLPDSYTTGNVWPAAVANTMSDAHLAEQTKIGTGASTPTAGKVLTGTGTGTSAWQTPTNTNLTPQSSQTANFTASAGSYYPVNATSGAITATLPSSSTTSQPISIEKTDSSLNIVTITGTIDGSSSNVSLKLTKDGKTFIPDASGGWIAYSTNLSLSSLDNHFQAVYNAKQYGATGNLKNVIDGVSTASSTTFTSATASFTSADVGKYIEIPGAGASSATLVTTIASYSSATTVTLTASASTSATAISFWYGTDDTAALQAMVNACLGTLGSGAGGTMYVPQGNYLVSTRIKLLGSNYIFRGDGIGATMFRLAAMANQEILISGNGHSDDPAAGDTGTVVNSNNVWFMDFMLDGNKSNQIAQASWTGSYKYGPSATRNLLRFRADAQNSYGGGAIRVFAYNGIQNGLSCESQAQGSFINCRVENMDQNGMWAENGGNWDISNNYTRSNGQNQSIGGSGIRIASFGGFTVIGNNCKGDAGEGIKIQSSGNGVVSGNAIYRAGWNSGGSNPTYPSSGIYSSVSNNIVISNNAFWGCYGNGITLNGNTYTSVVGNTFQRSGQYANATYRDIYFTYENGGSSNYHCTITGNTFNNDTSSPYYANAVAYNIGADSASAHYNNAIFDNRFGTPTVQAVYNMFNGNTYGPHDGLNPQALYNYGYAYGTITLNPLNGNYLKATGYNSTSAVTISAGIYIGQQFVFEYAQDSGGKQLSWTNATFQGGIVPVFSGIASTSDYLLFTWDGTTWHGNAYVKRNTYKNYGYFASSGTQAITPSTDGDVIEGTGYQGTTPLTIGNGSFVGEQFTLIFNQDSGGKVISWPTNVRWTAGYAPNLSTIPYTADEFLFTWNGSTWMGSISNNLINQKFVGDVQVNSLVTASAPTVVVTGTVGTTTYAYEIVAYNSDGDGIPSAATTVTTGNATLTTGNYNALSWNSVAGATGYKVLRNVSGAGWLLLTSTNAGTTSLQDNGTYTGTSYTASTINPGGNLSLGGKLSITSGTGQSMGTATLIAGTVTITNAKVTSSSLIFLTATSTSANSGVLSVGTKTAGTSFVVTSSNAADTSTFNWWIVN